MSVVNVLVVGAGIWGASTALALQQRGYKVTLCDMWGPGNIWSGSGGLSRIIRLGYGSDEVYIDLTARSFQMWDELFKQTGFRQYLETGLLWLFTDSEVGYVADSAERIMHHGYLMQELPVKEACQKYPVFSFEGIERVFFEKKAGIIYAQSCCRDMVKYFVDLGGKYIEGKAEIQGIDYSDPTILVNGQKISSDYSVWACGPWNRTLFPDILKDITYISKQDVYYFAVPVDRYRQFSAPEMPGWFEYDRNSPFYYGMPCHLNQGFKIAYDDRSELFDPDQDDRVATEHCLRKARSFLARRFPSISGCPLLNVRVCQYENSIDGHFILTRHPANDRILIMGGSSGHGFKMGPALGALVATCIAEERDLPAFFSLDRFSQKQKRTSQFS